MPRNPPPVAPLRQSVDALIVLQHAADAFERAPQLTIEASPVTVAGGGTGDPAWDLTWARNVVLLSDGRLATYSSIGNRMLIFRADGRGQRVIGRQGAGPGEFMRGDLVRWNRDTLLLADAGNRRFNWILPDRGIVADSLALHGFRLGAERIAGVLPGHRVVMHSATHWIQSIGKDGITRTETPIVVVRGAGGGAREIVKVQDLEMGPMETRFRGRPRVIGMPLRLTRYAHVVVWDTLIATATGDGYRIDLRNADGRVLSTLTVPGSRRPVTQAMREVVIRRELDRLEGPRSEPLIDPAESKRLAREVPFADSLPPYEGLFVTPNKTLWVVDAIAPGDTTWSATAFRKDGAIVARIRANGTAQPVAFSNDRVVLRAEDQDGVVSLRVHRIVPRPRG